ncbi:MAG TPA: HlyC/CorC family transporter [Rhizomicrobium sp.]|jgi:Mg2+/Co2+ transporter CorB|nr:HlyC/CorC family transporter [Rhizomicrobium sp.]
MDTALILSLGGIALLIAMSAFFAGSETALTAVSRGKMLRLEQQGSSAAHHVNKLSNDRERLIGALLLGNTFINILASSLATAMFEDRLGEHGVAIVATVMTVAVLVFAEVMPKTLAIARTDRFALLVAWPVRFVVTVLGPVVDLVQIVVWRILNLFGVRENDEMEEGAAHDEIRGTVELHHQEGAVGREHRDMIGGVLDLNELQLGDVMIHRKNMVSLNADLTLGDCVETVLSASHTRIPVWRDDPENIVGVLHTKDVALAAITRPADLAKLPLGALMHEPWFVPETTTLQEQLRAFKERRSHFALVVDEYGALQGLVSLGDILDEIVGEIPDEHAKSSPAGIRAQPDGSFNIDGDVPIREINRALDWHLPDEEATTIAGLVIHEAQTIPDTGQRFTFHGFKFEILRKQRNQLTCVRVVPPEPPAPVEPPKSLKPL